MSDQFGDDPFDPKTDNLESETPLLDEVISDAIHASLLDVHTAMPAKVVQVKGSQKIDVQPMFQKQFNDGSTVDLPIIQDVPVIMPRGADYWLKVPVAVGDTGLLVFCERSIDKWTVSGGTVNPGDPRKFDLSDAVFLPGMYPFSAQIPDNSTDMVLHNGDAEIQVKKSGRFKIKNSSQETFQIMVDLLETLIEALIETGFGPAPFTDETIFELEDIKTRIETLKG